jgi:hypothetical protein
VGALLDALDIDVIPLPASQTAPPQTIDLHHHSSKRQRSTPSRSIPQHDGFQVGQVAWESLVEGPGVVVMAARGRRQSRSRVKESLTVDEHDDRR